MEVTAQAAGLPAGRAVDRSVALGVVTRGLSADGVHSPGVRPA